MTLRSTLRMSLAAVAAMLALAACQFGAVKGPAVGGRPTPRWVIEGVPLDFITGGGWFAVQGDEVGTQPGVTANFGWHGGVKNGNWWGNGNYIDHGIGLHVNVTSVTGYARIFEDGTDSTGHPTGTREICGYADTDLYGSVRFVVYMQDFGEPGRQDKFYIGLYDNGGVLFYRAEGSLGDPTPGGGNIQLHRGNSSNTAPATPCDCSPDPFG